MLVRIFSKEQPPSVACLQEGCLVAGGEEQPWGPYSFLAVSCGCGIAHLLNAVGDARLWVLLELGCGVPEELLARA